MSENRETETSPRDSHTEHLVARSPIDFDEATFFQTLVANTSEGLLTLDTDSTIVYANPAVERIVGYTPSELVGESILTLIPERLHSSHTTGLQRYLDSGEKHIDWDGVELPALHKGGHEVPVSISFREHKYEGQRLFTGIFRDITDKKAFEETLQQERNTIQQLLETSPTGIMVVDDDGEIVRANTHAGVLYDRAPDDLRGHTYESIERDVVGEAGKPLPDADHPISRVFATGEPVYNAVIGIEQLIGKRTWVSMSAVPIREPDGTIERVITTTEDVTERREREQRLRAFRKAIDHAGHAIYLMDTDGTIEYVNTAFERQTGYSAEDALGETPRILSSGEHSKEFYADLWKTILSGEVWTGEVVNQRKSNETYTVNQTIAPITTENGNVERFIVIKTDVTEQKEREQTLRRQRNTLERLRQITDSLNSIHHALIRSSTRKELEQLLCDTLSSSEAYTAAWIGEYIAVNETLEPRAWTGIEEADLAEEVESVNDKRTHGITERAIQTGDVQASQNLATNLSERNAQDSAFRLGSNAAAAVPLVYGETIYGVLCLHSNRSFAFDETEQQLLGEIGERIGHAIHATKNRQLLYADTKVELEFRCTASDVPFIDVTERLDCRMTLAKSTPTSESAFAFYTDVEGAPPEHVCDRLETFAAIDHARPLQTTDESGIIECRVIGSSPVLTLIEQGTTPKSVVFENGEASIVAETVPEANTRAIVEGLQAAFTQTEFISKRTVDQSALATGDAAANPLEALTERQQEVLEVAYHAGYFNSPRATSGEELAETLGISSATFYQHIRKGSRNLLDELAISES